MVRRVGSRQMLVLGDEASIHGTVQQKHLQQSRSGGLMGRVPVKVGANDKLFP